MALFARAKLHEDIGKFVLKTSVVEETYQLSIAIDMADLQVASTKRKIFFVAVATV